MRSVAVAVAVAVVAASSVVLPQDGAATGGASANCDGQGACKATVSVTNCVISVAPDVLPVTGKNVIIFWELDALSMLYQFPDDGITLKDPSDEFDQPVSLALRKKFKLHDKNSVPRTYPYTVKVQRLVLLNWVDCPPLDPSIMNR